MFDILSLHFKVIRASYMLYKNHHQFEVSFYQGDHMSNPYQP